MKRNILIGITGSIAAYKVPDLVKMLVDNSFNTKVVLTDCANNFVTKLTLASISKNQVFTNAPDYSNHMYCANPMLHIELARFADLILIVPTTANFIAKLANGLCDDLLSTICIASKSKIVLVPAMNQAMWANLAVQSNLQKIISYGITVFEPVNGKQLCGEVGIGTMLDINEIFNQVVDMMR